MGSQSGKDLWSSAHIANLRAFVHASDRDGSGPLFAAVDPEWSPSAEEARPGSPPLAPARESNLVSQERRDRLWRRSTLPTISPYRTSDSESPRYSYCTGSTGSHPQGPATPPRRTTYLTSGTTGLGGADNPRCGTGEEPLGLPTAAASPAAGKGSIECTSLLTPRTRSILGGSTMIRSPIETSAISARCFRPSGAQLPRHELHQYALLVQQRIIMETTASSDGGLRRPKSI